MAELAAKIYGDLIEFGPDFALKGRAVGMKPLVITWGLD
jgi:hypothetical protein